MRKLISATMALAAMAALSSCDKGEESSDYSQSDQYEKPMTRTVLPEGCEVWNPRVPGLVEFYIYIYDTDSNRVDVDSPIHERLHGEEWKYENYLECRGGQGHVYQSCYDSPPDPRMEYVRYTPDDEVIPEGYHGRYSWYELFNPDLGSGTQAVGYSQSDLSVGSEESLTWHWADGTTDNVSFRIYKNPYPDIDANALVEYRLNGKPATSRMRLYK